jgi:SSS family solute:Na+ symporter
MLVVFFAIIISVGLYFRKRTANVTDFVLGGRSVGPWISAFSYGVTYFSAVVFIGFAGQFGWRYGISAVWIGLGNAIIGSFLAWHLLGRRTRMMTNHLQSATMPEFFGRRYFSQNLKIAASIIIFTFMIPYTASLFNGLSILFSMSFGIPFEVCILMMCVVTAIFVVAGGYFAAAVNDFIQGIIMLSSIVAIIFAVIKSLGGFGSAFTALANVAPNALDVGKATEPGIFATIFGPDPLSLFAVVILTSLGAWGLPQMVARFYAIKSETMIGKGAIVTTLFAFVVAGGSYFLGSFSRVLFTPKCANIDIPACTDILPCINFPKCSPVVFDVIMPTILTGLSGGLIAIVIIMVFAATISTLSALVLSSATTITLDFIRGNIIKNMTDKKQILWLRAFIVLFIVLSAVNAIAAYRFDDFYIAQLMGIAWGAMAGSFLAPFLYGLYWKRVTSISIWCNFIFSVGLMTLNVFFRPAFPELIRSPINLGAFCIFAGLVIIPVVSLLTSAPDKANVDKCFSVFGN